MSFVRFLKSLLQAPSYPVVPGPTCPGLTWDFPGATGCLAEPNAMGFFCCASHQSRLGTCWKGDRSVRGTVGHIHVLVCVCVSTSIRTPFHVHWGCYLLWLL